MEPQQHNALECEGTLNPAVVRGPDGHLYLFPRLVGAGNYSRIGICRVLFNELGDPCGVERLGIALEPETDYERNGVGGGGCEDPRISYVQPLGKFLMTYTAFSSRGPRIALAVSQDLLNWRRMGLARFRTEQGLDWDTLPNKDATLFPATVSNLDGQPALAMLHRPTFSGNAAEPESIWISYRPLQDTLSEFCGHTRLAGPEAAWEQVKIGCGTPPVLTPRGWLVVYHGVRADGLGKLIYSAGMMLLQAQDPRILLYRSPTPVLTPLLPLERFGTVENVVFPTGIDRRDDLGCPDRFDVYYGMADRRIGVARLDLPPGDL